MDKSDDTSAKRILIVDDSEEVRSFLSETLSQAGFLVEAPKRPEMAPSLARQQRPDAILLELSLPGGLDGFDLLQLFGRDPGLKGVPVLIVTARSDRNDVTRALKLGARDYVIKPIEAEKLVARVNNSLELSAAGASGSKDAEDAEDADEGEVSVARQPSKPPPGISEPPAPTSEQAN